MSKQIFVQAQADHIASLYKAAPISAIEELVWNALDADAREVRIELITNVLGAVEGLRIVDDGSGIDVLKTESTFGSLGGSWKRLSSLTSSTHRRLHGRHGRGRFKAFALGSRVDWRTTARVGGELVSFDIWGESSNPGVFQIDAIEPGPATGTEVTVSGASVNCDSLLSTAETVQTLASKFALYLKSYPDVRIFFNGIPVTPIIVQKKLTDYRLTLTNGAEARLEVIEWKRKFAGSGRLVFAGLDGFELHETATGVRAGGASYTAYLVSSRFTALNAENALVMDELNAEVRQYVEAAKKALKAHFRAVQEERASALVQAWSEEGSHPYAADDASPERTRFDALAVEFASQIESFNDWSVSERRLVLGLLNQVVSQDPQASLKTWLGKGRPS